MNDSVSPYRDPVAEQQNAEEKFRIRAELINGKWLKASDNLLAAKQTRRSCEELVAQLQQAVLRARNRVSNATAERSDDREIAKYELAYLQRQEAEALANLEAARAAVEEATRQVIAVATPDPPEAA